MIEYLFRKTIAFLSSLFIIASLTFFLMKMIPGNPFSEEQALNSDIEKILHKQYGWDRPLLIQYVDYLKQLLHGQLGFSIKYPDISVKQIIQEGFPISARLGLQALILSLFFGISFGAIAAIKSYQWEDRAILLLTTGGLAIPSFILATLLQYCFAIYFPIFPLARWGTFAQTILPSLALAAGPMAFIARLTRTGLLEVLRAEYVKLAKAKGLPLKYWLFQHALRNALLPVLSYLGPLLANVLIGSFIIEKVFSIPGLGQWLVISVANRDYSVIMGLTLFYSLILLTTVFLVDILYVFWDPRIRLVRRS